MTDPPPKNLRIVLCFPVEERHCRQLAAAAPGCEIVDAGQERIAAELPAADIFIGHAKVPVPWPEVVRQGRLRWIQSSAAGLDHCLTPEVIASDIPVTSASGLFANQVAEQTMYLILGLVRSGATFFAAQQRHEFVRRPTRDLLGSTVGIVGFGGNGLRIAEVLIPFGVRILATDLFPCEPPPGVEAVWPADRLPDLLAQSDLVVLAVPLNEQTQHLINSAALAQMKPSALLVNVARGPVVDQLALVDALRSGRLAGAGLDVAEVEPPPQDDPLWDAPNVIITPHVGAQSARRVDVTVDFACENLRRFFTGEPLLNLVDKQLGFPRRAP